MAEDMWKLSADDVAVSCPAVGRIGLLRVRPPFDGAALSRWAGTDLPTRPNSVIGDDRRALWLAPDSWLLLNCQPEEASPDGMLALFSDVSDGKAVFEVRGRRAATLLSCGTSLDLRLRTLGAGMCGQTLFAQIHVLIERLPGEEAFRLYADVSYRTYLKDWFAQALTSF